MFQNSWSIKLSQSPLHVTVACLPEPSLVYQGESNQLSVFTKNETHNLPIRKQIISLGTIKNNLVLVLTRYNLSCFDFLSNQEIFTKQFENSEKLFVINQKIYVVSGTSLWCFDSNGQEQYVNHLPAPITTITNVVNSFGSASQSEDIVIATSDLSMYRYSKLNIVFDYAKTIGLATSLCWVGKGVMVGTQEGPIAFYQSKKYKWKAKSIHSTLKIARFNEVSQYNQNAQFVAQKQDKIIVLRVDGNIELRDWENGATLSKTKVGQAIINSFINDFRKQGTNQILCVLKSGTVKAINLKDQSSQKSKQKNAITLSQALNNENQTEDLNKLKQQLLYNIRQMTALLQKKQDEDTVSEQILKQDFKMTVSLEYKDGLMLQIQASNGYLSGITFQQAIAPYFVDKADKILYKFPNSSRYTGELICEILAHSSLSTLKYEVKKIQIFLPKFWKWGLDSKVRGKISGKVSLKIKERNSRFILWSKQCFYMNISSKQQQRLENLDQMKLRYYNWYQNKEMEIVFNQTNGTVQISCDCLQTMGDIFQDLVNYVGIKHLNSKLQFTQEKEKIKKLLQVVEKLSQTKTNITTDLADSINNIKFLLVKSQSARVVGEMASFRKTYAEIMEQNRNMITEIEKKNINTKILTQTLKNVNIFINQIANVRYGQPKNQVIAKCREAIKKKKFPEIYNLMDNGADVTD